MTRVRDGDSQLPSSPDVSHPPFDCSDHCLTALLTGKKTLYIFVLMICMGLQWVNQTIPIWHQFLNILRGEEIFST